MELRRVLQSLACGPVGTRILLKEPKPSSSSSSSREVQDADTFTPNTDFTHKLFRIKVNGTIQSKETAAEEVVMTHAEVFRDREYQVLSLSLSLSVYNAFSIMPVLIFYRFLILFLFCFNVN